MPIVVLDCLKTHHQIDAVIRNRNSVARANHELQIAPAILPGGMDNRFFREIDADHMRGQASQDFAAVSFAARNVQHPLPASKLRRPMVTMAVLQLNLASDLRHIALAGPWKVACCH